MKVHEFLSKELKLEQTLKLDFAVKPIIMSPSCSTNLISFISLKNKVDGLKMRKIQILGDYIIARVYHSYGRMHELYF